MSAKQKVKLYLIPTPIGEGGERETPPENIRIIESLDYFFVENVRTARRYIASLKLGRPIDDITFIELSEHTPIDEIETMLLPLLNQTESLSGNIPNSNLKRGRVSPNVDLKVEGMSGAVVSPNADSKVEGLYLNEVSPNVDSKVEGLYSNEVSPKSDSTVEGVGSTSVGEPAVRHCGMLSEAGLPCVADPGSRLVEVAHRLGVEVVPLVGSSSLMLALMASGANGQSFSFVGYLPIKDVERQRAIKQLEARAKKEQQTQIFIETPYRNLSLFDHLLSTLSPQTMLTVASSLMTQNQRIKTLSIAQWQSSPKPHINKIPAIFILFSNF